MKPPLPVDASMPLIAVLSAMLFPGDDDDDDDKRNRQAYYAQQHRHALKPFIEDGGILQREHALLLAETEVVSVDILERWDKGIAIGEMTYLLLGLMQTSPNLASWSNAFKLVQARRVEANLPASRTYLYEDVRRDFMPVAHLWCAYIRRNGVFKSDHDVGYSIDHDTQYFVLESEIILDIMRSHSPDRDKAEPFLNGEFLRPPRDWLPPEKLTGWPDDPGTVNVFTLPEQNLEILKPAGRPKKL